MSSHEPLPCEKIFHKLCEIFLFPFPAFIVFFSLSSSFIVPFQGLISSFLSLSLYSTSSASSPWSPSISKAAYLLAELNFCKNIRTDRSRMSMESLKEHEGDDFITLTACLSTVKCLKKLQSAVVVLTSARSGLTGVGVSSYFFGSGGGLESRSLLLSFLQSQ